MYVHINKSIHVLYTSSIRNACIDTIQSISSGTERNDEKLLRKLSTKKRINSSKVLT